jgi:hypothetical protein
VDKGRDPSRRRQQAEIAEATRRLGVIQRREAVERRAARRSAKRR